MPIMNGRGHVLCGGGGLQASLDGNYLPFPTYGGGCWLDDVIALEQLRAGPVLATWSGGDPVPLERAANDFAGGGGAFIAWNADYGVWGSIEHYLTGTPEDIHNHLAVAGTAGPRSVAPDGTIGYIPNRQNGYSLALVSPEGNVVFIPGILPVDVQVLGDGVAIWRGGAQGRAPTRPTLADAQGIQMQTFAGKDWLLYWSEKAGCVLQKDGNPNGVILDIRPLEFNPSMRVVNDELWIAWSTTQGEGPNDLVICAMNSDGAIRYERQATGVVPAVPRWVDLSVAVTPPIVVPPPVIPPPVIPPPGVTSFPLATPYIPRT